jgi:hypothetical protein
MGGTQQSPAAEKQPLPSGMGTTGSSDFPSTAWTSFVPTHQCDQDPALSEGGTLSGPVEHVGRTSQYFEELDNVASTMPTSFVRFQSSASVHRLEKPASKGLSPFNTTTRDVLSAVGPAAKSLLKIYFALVDCIFPVCVSEQLNDYFTRLASDSQEPTLEVSEDQAVAPLLACMLVCAARCLLEKPTG